MNIGKLQSIDFFKNQDLQYAFDGLTKVLNREMISSYLAYLVQAKSPFTVCLCDVDNFKSVNDNYGHMLGDEILQIIAADIENTIGLKGVVGRYGGDEFMIILDGIITYFVPYYMYKLNIFYPMLMPMRALTTKEALKTSIQNGLTR